MTFEIGTIIAAGFTLASIIGSASYLVGTAQLKGQLEVLCTKLEAITHKDNEQDRRLNSVDRQLDQIRAKFVRRVDCPECDN